MYASHQVDLAAFGRGRPNIMGASVIETLDLHLNDYLLVIEDNSQD